MAEALYRKYRPQIFEDVVGQEPIERTLKNALAQDKVSHAYLFCGPRGTGKTTTARLLAKALLCCKGPTPEPDGTCDDCLLIADGAHPDVYELDAASRTGVENVREEIIGRLQFAPTRGTRKVYIIDEVHMLSTAAFNALLKTLEEPPGHVVFILCTTDPQKVPETIHSRCQRFDFRRIAPEAIVSRLGAICMAEGVEFEGEALDLIAHRAEGGLRNALTSLEQIMAFEGGTVTLAGAERLLGSIDSNDLAEIIAYIGKRDIANCLRWTAEYVETGSDLAQFVLDVADHVRNLYIISLAGDDVELDMSETTRKQMVEELAWYGPDRLARCMGVLGDLTAELKTSSNPRLSFEIALTRLVRPDSDLTLESLAERIEALESGYSAVAPVHPGAPLPIQAAQNGADHAGSGTGRIAQAAWEGGIVQSAAADGSASGSSDREDANAYASGQGPQQSVAGGFSGAPSPLAESAGAVPRESDGFAASDDAARPAVRQARLEAAATRAVAASEGASSPLANPATLQRAWQSAMTLVKKQKMVYGALFMNTRVSYQEASGAIEVEFPAESDFAFNAVQKPEAQDILAAALEKTIGHPVAVAYRRGAQAGAGAGAYAAPMRGAAAAQPIKMPAEARMPAKEQMLAEEPTPPLAHDLPDASEVPAAVPSQMQEADLNAAYDIPYEQVPYEDLDGAYWDQYGGTDSFAGMPVAPAAADLASADQGLAEAGVSADDMRQDSWHESSMRATAGAGHENAAASSVNAADAGELQSLLQAGFGAGVLFEEVEEAGEG